MVPAPHGWWHSRRSLPSSDHPPTALRRAPRRRCRPPRCRPSLLRTPPRSARCYARPVRRPPPIVPHLRPPHARSGPPRSCPSPPPPPPAPRSPRVGGSPGAWFARDRSTNARTANQRYRCWACPLTRTTTPKDTSTSAPAGVVPPSLESGRSLRPRRVCCGHACFPPFARRAVALGRAAACPTPEAARWWAASIVARSRTWVQVGKERRILASMSHPVRVVISFALRVSSVLGTRPRVAVAGAACARR